MDNSKSQNRVGMIAHSYYLFDPRVRRQAEALANAGYKVEVLCLGEAHGVGQPRLASKEIVNGVTVHRLPIRKKRGSSLRYFFEYSMLTIMGALKLTWLHLAKRFKVIHVHNMPDFLVFSGLIPFCTGAKLILDIHDPMYELYSSKNPTRKNKLFLQSLKWQEKLSCWFAQRVVSVNETMRENLIAKGVPPKKIFILPNFPDSKLFPIRRDRKSWPRRRDKLVLLYSGTVTDHYNLDVAIKAVARAAEHVPNIRLRILGEGDKLKEILQLAETLGISDLVKHLKPVPADEVKFEMANADIGISSHKAGIFGDLYFSTKILEFMTQGLPVLTSRTYTIDRYIREDSIFYFEPGNSEDMARQIIFIWRNPKVVNNKINNARNLLSRFSWEDEKAKFIEFYHDLLCRNVEEN